MSLISIPFSVPVFQVIPYFVNMLGAEVGRWLSKIVPVRHRRQPMDLRSNVDNVEVRVTS